MQLQAQKFKSFYADKKLSNVILGNIYKVTAN